jgi:hypothetical protein
MLVKHRQQFTILRNQLTTIQVAASHLTEVINRSCQQY